MLGTFKFVCIEDDFNNFMIFLGGAHHVRNAHVRNCMMATEMLKMPVRNPTVAVRMVNPNSPSMNAITGLQ